jgi:hypothetical protein
MKKIFSNNRLIALAFFTVFSVGMAPAVRSNDKNPVVPVELKFAGFIKNQPLFQLSFFGNPEQNEFTILIRDEYGNSLYRENIIGETFTKKFLLNTNEIGDNLVRFEIFCKKTRKSVTYEVNRNTRFEQEMVINELK